MLNSNYGDPTGQHIWCYTWKSCGDFHTRTNFYPQIRSMALWSGFSFYFYIVTAQIARTFDRSSVEDTTRYRSNAPSPRQRRQLQRQVWISLVFLPFSLSLCPISRSRNCRFVSILLNHSLFLCLSAVKVMFLFELTSSLLEKLALAAN